VCEENPHPKGYRYFSTVKLGNRIENKAFLGKTSSMFFFIFRKKRNWMQLYFKPYFQGSRRGNFFDKKRKKLCELFALNFRV